MASPNFLLGAVFPWVLVIVINIAIYETLVPDGRSLVDWFAGIDEQFRAYAALGIALALAAIAGLSDQLVDVATRPRAYQFYRPEPDLKQPNALHLAEIQSTNLALHGSANLMIGIGASIWLNTALLATHQNSFWVSALVVVALWFLMLLSATLAFIQQEALTRLLPNIERIDG